MERVVLQGTDNTEKGAGKGDLIYIAETNMEYVTEPIHEHKTE